MLSGTENWRKINQGKYPLGKIKLIILREMGLGKACENHFRSKETNMLI